MPGLFCSGMGAPLCRSRMDSHCTDRRGVQRGKAPLALGHPIGASSIPVGKGSLEGNSVPLGGRFPKEGSAFLGTRLSLGKSSVLYALSALLRKCGCHRGGQGHLKRQESRAVIARRGAASAGLVSSADRAYMKAPVPRPTPNYGTKCPRRIATLTKKQTDFSLKIEMGGKPF